MAWFNSEECKHYEPPISSTYWNSIPDFKLQHNFDTIRNVDFEIDSEIYIGTVETDIPTIENEEQKSSSEDYEDQLSDDLEQSVNVSEKTPLTEEQRKNARRARKAGNSFFIYSC